MRCAGLSVFGLGYYGCCEPLHHKIDLIRALPDVRKISMSPFVDVETGAEAIAGTTRYEPQRLWEWNDIACELVAVAV